MLRGSLRSLLLAGQGEGGLGRAPSGDLERRAPGLWLEVAAGWFFQAAWAVPGAEPFALVVEQCARVAAWWGLAEVVAGR